MTFDSRFFNDRLNTMHVDLMSIDVKCRQQGFIGKDVYPLGKPAGSHGNQSYRFGRKNIRTAIACCTHTKLQVVIRRFGVEWLHVKMMGDAILELSHFWQS